MAIESMSFMPRDRRNDFIIYYLYDFEQYECRYFASKDDMLRWVGNYGYKNLLRDYNTTGKDTRIDYERCSWNKQGDAYYPYKKLRRYLITDENDRHINLSEIEQDVEDYILRSLQLYRDDRCHMWGRRRRTRYYRSDHLYLRQYSHDEDLKVYRREGIKVNARCIQRNVYEWWGSRDAIETMRVGKTIKFASNGKRNYIVEALHRNNKLYWIVLIFLNILKYLLDIN